MHTLRHAIGAVLDTFIHPDTLPNDFVLFTFYRGAEPRTAAPRCFYSLDSRESELYSSRNRLQYRVGICSFPWSVGIYLSWPATAQRGGAASSRLRLRLYSHTRSTVSCMVPDRCSAEALGAGQQAAAKPFRRAAYTFTRRHHDTALRLHARLKREPGPARSPTNS